MNNLNQVIDFIITKFRNTAIAFDEPKIRKFLEQLAQPNSLDFSHGKRLLLNIAIDLKFGNVSAEDYVVFLDQLPPTFGDPLKAFDGLNPPEDLNGFKKAARKGKPQDYYNNTEVYSFYKYVVGRTVTDESSFSDWDTKIKSDFDDGENLNNDIQESLNGVRLPTRQKLLWLTSDASTINMVAVGLNERALNVFDKLGLPQDITETDGVGYAKKQRLAIKLPESLNIDAVVTNALCDSYDNSGGYDGLFMSNNTRADNWGQTFFRSGMNVGDAGMQERVCKPVTLSKDITVQLIGKIDNLPIRNYDNFLKIAFDKLNQPS